MKITYSDEGAYARIWLTGPFWQLAKARRIADAGLDESPVNTWESRGLTFQITLYGKTHMYSGRIRRWLRPWRGHPDEP